MGKFENLPKWAQQMISQLQDQVSNLQEQLDVALGTKRTRLGYGWRVQLPNPKICIPENETVFFIFDESTHRNITVRFSQNGRGISINSSVNRLSVYPEAANAVRIELE